MPWQRRAAALALGALSGASSIGCGEEVYVKAVDLRFEPSRVALKAGETVTWTNTGQTTHNVKGPGFFSNAMEPGSRYSFRFEKAGTFGYLCTFHPATMRGRVMVED